MVVPMAPCVCLRRGVEGMESKKKGFQVGECGGVVEGSCCFMVKKGLGVST